MKCFSMLCDNLKTTGMLHFLKVAKIYPTKSLGLGTVVAGVGVGRVWRYSFFNNLSFSLAIGILSFSIPS